MPDFYTNAVTYWPTFTDLLLRRHVFIPPGTTNLTLGLAIDNDAQIYLNGLLITNASQIYVGGVLTNQAFNADGWFVHEGPAAYDSLLLDGISPTNWHAGDNLLAVRGHDRGVVTFADVRLTGWPPPSGTGNDTLAFVSPTNGQNFLITPTNILLTVTNGAGAVTNVQFLLNDTNSLGTVTASNGLFTLLWTNATAGVWKVTATNDATPAASTTLFVTNNAMPTVTILSPTNFQSFTGTTNVTLVALASDAEDGTNVSVVFYYFTNSIGTAVHTGGATNSLVWSNLIAGVYPIVAVATDTRGASTTSAITVFKVAPTNPPPIVQIVYPTNNAVFASGSDVYILANAYATNGGGTITNVEFFVNGQTIGSDPTAPYEITKCCWKPGTYTLTAKATDNFGGSSVSTNQITIAQDSPVGSGFWDAEFGLGVYSSFFNDGPVNPNDKVNTVAVGPNNVIYASPLYSIGTKLSADGTTWTTNTLPQSGGYYDNWTVIFPDGTNVYFCPEPGDPDICTNVLVWDGSNAYPVGNGLNAGYSLIVRAIADIGGNIYVGGNFTSVGSGADLDTNVQYIAELNVVSNRWFPVGNGLSALNNDRNGGGVYSITSIGNDLYIGGLFANAGGNTNANYVARLVNNTWTNLGAGISVSTNYEYPVTALAACGTNLFVGGQFQTVAGYTNANGIAVWNTVNWRTMNGGVGQDPTSGNGSVLVNTISVHGDSVFVGGAFTNVLNGTTVIPDNNIAVATWDEAGQDWVWSGLDGGVFWNYSGGYVGQTFVAQGDDPGRYDLYICGVFDSAGSSLLNSPGIARWRVGYPPPPSVPIVKITSPSSPAVYTNSPASITLTGLAVSDYTNIDEAHFYSNGNVVGTPQAVIYANTTNFVTFTNVWSSPPPGAYLITAWAKDHNQLLGLSAPLVVSIKSTNNTIMAIDDQYTIPQGTLSATLNVLTNDDPATGLKISGIVKPDNELGTVNVSQDGTCLIYTPLPNKYGTDLFFYNVTNASGAQDSASVTVHILPAPVVQINSPYDGSTFAASGNITVIVSAYSYDGSVTNVVLNVNGAAYGQAATNVSDFTWSTNAPAFYTFTAVATDDLGMTSTSPPVTVAITNNATATNLLTAEIDNLPVTYSVLDTKELTVVSNGLFDLRGQASDPIASDPVAYEVLLHPATNDDITIANVTPPPRDVNGFHQGGDIDGDLGTIDLTAIPNGTYDLELIVHGGGGQANATTTFQLDSQLKIGQFSFSQQDLVLPVNGIPITINRTYNSQNPNSGDFGYGWTFAVNSMDVQLDDQRQDVTIGSDQAPWAPDKDSDNGLPQTVSVRTGGGWDVTLTLPNGRLATYVFTPRYAPSECRAYAEWTPPPGVTAKLTPLDSGIINLIPTYPPYWQDSDNSFYPSDFVHHDVKGWILTTQDGTQYYITRGTANDIIYDTGNQDFVSARVYGPPVLTKIVQRSGDTIVIGPNSISHQNTNGTTRAISFDRDSAGRITAIYDPNGGTNGLPAVKYVYNQDTGNLIWVCKLVDRSAGIYVTNKYDYDNPNFPHYITSIENGDGVPVARNFYDDSGRLTAVQDADGNLTQFIHNLTNDMEVVVDRMGHTNTYVYDPRGNVVAQTNALGQVTRMAYDGNNNKTNEILCLGGQPYATNSYVYDDKFNVMLCSTDPLGHTNSFTYDQTYGLLTSSTDARGHTTTNHYDPNTGELTSTVDALGHANNYYYSGGLLVGSSDAIGTATTNYYDGNENLIATATLDASGAILSSNTFTYDDNGNRLTSTVWRRVSGAWTGATTTYVYDAMNRVVQTIDPDGGTNTVVYDATGKQQETIDPLGHATRYTYDNQGRLVQTTYPDQTTETFAYDADGNRTSSVDRGGRTTTYVYDALNRLVETVYPDGATNGTVYDGVGRVAQTIDARGTITGYAYDAAGRRLAVTNAFGTGVQTIASYGYDADGNQTTFTDGLGHTTTNVFDALNRLVAVDYPDQAKTFTGYDADGRRVAETNQDNIVTLFGYDGAGRLVSVTNAVGTAQQTVTRYGYDEAGNEIAQIDALNRTNSYAYDNMGRRVAHTLPGSQTESFAYDLDGNPIYQTNFNGAVITNVYDAMNRLTNRSSVFGYHVSFAYSPTGQRTNMADGSGSTAYLYDSRDRLTNKVVAWTGGPTIALNYGYDANGNVTNIWSDTSSGVNLAYGYDPLNRLTNVLANGSAAAGYGYDSAGNLQGVRYGNGVTNLCQYDSLNRLTSQTWKLNTTPLASFDYQLGLSGNRTNLSETVNGVSRTYAWQYDNLYRLTNETISAVGDVGYAYDPVGNRTNRDSTVSQLPTASSSYNTNDWLQTDACDSDGNTLWSTNGTVRGPYGYDVENRLTNYNNSIYLTYDGDGNRVEKTAGGTTIYYLVDDRNPSGYAQVLEEWTATGGTTNLSRVYTYGLDLISQRVPNTSTNYFVFDGHGSTRLLTDAGGAVVNAFAYDAFGTLIASNGAPQTTYLYCGQQFDPDLGLYYNRARYLNPGTGRFWTMDSFDGNNEDPLSLHKSLYVENDPVNNVDPNGHDLISLSISMSISSSLDSLYNGGVIVAGNAMQATLFGVQANESANAILVNYLAGVGASVAVGAGAAMIGRAVSEVLYGGSLDAEEAITATGGHYGGSEGETIGGSFPKVFGNFNDMGPEACVPSVAAYLKTEKTGQMTWATDVTRGMHISSQSNPIGSITAATARIQEWAGVGLEQDMAAGLNWSAVSTKDEGYYTVFFGKQGGHVVVGRVGGGTKELIDVGSGGAPSVTLQDMIAKWGKVSGIYKVLAQQ